MSLVSLAQNFEDVMLWRALRDVSEGFYIDVGANDPLMHSVTHVFYARGWHGINVEANRGYFDLLQKERTRDINIHAAATNYDGRIQFFDIDDTGLSTTDAEVCEAHARIGFFGSAVEVEALTLASICRAHVTGDIHFLKIDVEGGTRAVIEGMDFAAFRPWIVLCEATKPMTQEQDFADWEGLLLEAGYQFVYADGLNRFYLANEQAHLRGRFEYPPNVFDGFQYGTGSEISARVLDAEREQFRARAESAEAHAAHLQAFATHVQGALDAQLQAYAERDATARGLEAERDALRSALIEVTRASEERAAAREAESGRLRAMLDEQAGFLAATRQQVDALSVSLQAAEQQRDTLQQQLEVSTGRLAEETAALVRERAAFEQETAVLLADKARLQAEKFALEQDKVRLEVAGAEIADRAARAETHAARLEATLRRITSSPAWRMTAPFRALSRG
ncbi:FkbM family methyltransferase [Azorhizobium sp. AG788]|nr:FkbM family methyltransferase [Azorhizobium sp. AG788]